VIRRFFSRLPIKLTILYSSLFMMIFMPIVLSYYYFTLTKIKEDVRQEFVASEMVFRQLVEMRSEQISDSVRLLTQDFGFREAVATSDTVTIDSALDNLKKRLDVGWAVVVDIDGAMIAGESVDSRTYRSMTTLLANAENQGSAADIAMIDGAVQQLVALPIRAPQLVGWAVFALKLNTTELQSMSEKSPVRFDAVLLHVADSGLWAQAPVMRSTLPADALEFVLTEVPAGERKILEMRGAGGGQLMLVSALPVAEASRPVVLVLRVRLRDAVGKYRDLFYTLLLIGAVGVVLLTLGSWALSVGVTRPLRKLASAARRVGQGDDYEVEGELERRSDEIGDLAASFSAMASEIKDRTRQLKAANANLESRVEERSKQLSVANVNLLKEIDQRKQSEEALLLAKIKAEEANRAKDDFLATMSHELRTPMNGIMGIVHYLKNAEMPEESRRNLDILEDSARSLLAILNDVLDFSKIESGKVEIRNQEFSLHGLITGMEELWRATASDKGLDFRIEMRFAESAMFIGDKTRIRQIINNYLNNALKFTQQGSVGLSAEVTDCDDDMVSLKLCVSDTGVGIREDEMPLLFEKFSQLEGGKARRFGGTGLGLAICRRLARAMGGEVGVDSTPGEGSHFWCVLPLKKSGASAELGSVAAVRGARSNPSDKAKNKLRILLVEDNEINVRVMSLFIEQLGYRVSGVARDGVEGVRMATGSRKWDVVLMDLRMPNMDGLEATRRIRKAGIDADSLPIIALTADTMESDMQACFDAGMTDFVSKPVSPDALARALEKAASVGDDRMSSVA
jgi:signal transduction histidine kinase